MSDVGTGELPQLCERLLRDAAGRAVLVLGDDGELLGHAGEVARLPEPALDAAAELVVALRAAAGDNDRLADAGALSACAVRLGHRGVLVVLFDGTSSAGLVRLRMRRAREQLVRLIDT